MHNTEFLSMPSVVLEISHCFVRAGLAGESAPRFTESAESAWAACNGTSSLPLSQYLLEMMHILFNEKLLCRPRDCRVLVVEKLFAPKRFREALFEVLLAECQVQTCFSIPPITCIHDSLFTLFFTTSILPLLFP